ncbi:hypothetical protein E1295_08835 [Nonomuraea mesophila]|uniref:Beta/gamma crystallin 'Greek key' domain-containing protein n=1 Tax=Nonomuraea mesophila TaxID=2530382 RepID=A0A4R5FUY3_9ACTN|nr:hypothetical protein [Nonomuraea mesophila]TDE57216.1 hypothetical protein E1295_08835 [Nonomuraea mesophila]
MKILQAISVAALGAGLALTGAGPASAQTAQAGGTAPACVGRSHADLGGFAFVKNRSCGRTVRVKIVIRLGKDSPCWSLKQGQMRRHNYWGKYQKVVTC